MITIDIKPQNASFINNKISKKEGSLIINSISFDELLHKVLIQSNTKMPQKAPLIFSPKKETPSKNNLFEDTKKIVAKKEILLEVLKTQPKEEISLVELNPEVSKNLSPKELKRLIKDTKNFLRDKILQSKEFKKVELVALPKTVKGLTQVAKKFDIDVSKITLEEVEIQSKPVPKPSLKVKEIPLFKVLHTTTKRSENLESLLSGDTQDNSFSQKVDRLNTPKADSFEVKVHEAKQMIKYLSTDVRTAIEDYKAPFTRVKLALNPQRLGSIELTVVQRGKNLHINLTSNNAAVNTLAIHAQELKVQLGNNGINNASLNFNNNSSDSNQSAFGQQQQNSQQRRDAQNEYNYFENEEKNEEVLNSLEIVVPNYA